MSGSGDGLPSFGGGKTNCEKISTRGLINSPNPKVLIKLKEGDFVELSLKSVTGPIVASFGGEIVGSVLATNMVGLIECMGLDHQYKGKIIVLKSAHCEILITSV